MDASSKLEEIEKRRAERKSALAVKKEEQKVKDLEALDALEIEHGDGSVCALQVEGYREGIPTMVVLKAPSQVEYKRFTDMIARASVKNSTSARVDAQHLIGKTCWLYPEKEEQTKMLEAFPGLLLAIALKATQLAEATQVEEGKG